MQANGGILSEVTETDFPRRSRALAAEIRDKKPDMVGLQEVAWWRINETASLDPINDGPSASETRFNFLQLLMDEVNRGKQRYRVAVVQNEFDFEAPADENEVPDDGEIQNLPGPGLEDAELNGRLTMRDVILVRKSKQVKTRNPTGGNFANLLPVTVAGAVPIDVTRGWTRVEAKVGRAHGSRSRTPISRRSTTRPRRPRSASSRPPRPASPAGTRTRTGRPSSSAT